nr:flavonoid O-glycosyltransferase UGT71A51 [Scutellaria baicalensis]
MSTEKTSLVFIPFTIMSHMVAAVKAAKLLADRDDRLSVTVLVMKLPMNDPKISSYTKNSPDSRINFVELPENNSDMAELMKNPKTMLPRLMEAQKGPIKDAVAKIMEAQKSIKLAGFIVDIFCSTFMDVAKDLAAPAYLFFTCGAASLGLMFRLQSFSDEENKSLSEFEHTDAVISCPTYLNPVPAKVWPPGLFDKDGVFINITRKLREVNGIIINTFLEFEHHAIAALSADEKIPPVYPIGPILQDEREDTEETKQQRSEILSWLDNQPDSSVVFLCFGTSGSFSEAQVKEIAVALENSGQRFLWSLRKPPAGKMGPPGEYENPAEVLPEGFLDRTAAVGRVLGWAPQIAVLAHPAVGGFVSHCGWNSTLESVWFGVPMAVWPLAAEQQANSFQLVKDFEMAVEIKMDYRMHSDEIVPAGKIETAVRELMDPDNKIRVKVKELQGKSKKALEEGESSYNFLATLIHNVIDNAV